MSTAGFGAITIAASCMSGNMTGGNFASLQAIEAATRVHNIGVPLGFDSGSQDEIDHATALVLPIWSAMLAYSNLELLSRQSPARKFGCLLVGIWLLGTVLKLWHSFVANKRFRTFAASNSSEQAVVMSKSFGGKIRHKLRLLSYRSGDLLDGLFVAKYKRYGPTHALKDFYGKPAVVHTIDPANLNAVLNTSWKNWRPSQNRTNTLKPLAQDSLLLAEGDTWHRKRKLITRHLGTRRAKDTSREEVHVQRLFEAIGNVDKDGWTDEVDLLDLLHRFALDSSTAFLLGKGADSQRSGVREKQRQAAMSKFNLVPAKGATEMNYDQAYEVIRQYLSRRSKLGSLYWMADGIEYRRACATMNRWADDLVEQAILKSSSDNGTPAEPKAKGDFGLISDLTQELKDPKEIRNLVMDLLIAGQNMTGTIAAWVFAQLEQHPDIYQRVREEVLSAFGDEHSPKASIVWNEMKSCTTLQHVVLETLRMYPLIANVSRTAKNDTIIPRGVGLEGSQPLAVPAGAAITCNLYLMHRRQEEWGDDAWEFNPDRWLGRKFGPEYAPYGVGPRVCVGQQISKTELSYLCVRMTQRFSDIKAPEGQDNLAKDYCVVVAPANGVKVRLRRA